MKIDVNHIIGAFVKGLTFVWLFICFFIESIIIIYGVERVFIDGKSIFPVLFLVFGIALSWATVQFIIMALWIFTRRY